MLNVALGLANVFIGGVGASMVFLMWLGAIPKSNFRTGVALALATTTLGAFTVIMTIAGGTS